MKKIFGALFSIVLFASPVHAAELFFGSAGEVIAPGEALFGVFLNTQGQKVNAIEGDIIFSPGILGYVGYRDGGSVITQWIEKPTHSGSTTATTVHFSGIIVGGINASDAFLFSFVGQPRTDVVGISAADVHVYANDGQGTELPITIQPLEVTVAEGGAESVVDPDVLPPEFGNVEIVQDPSLYDGRRVLVFSVVDKGSGVAKVEIREGENDWMEVQSPFELYDQIGTWRIELRATDASGNQSTHVIEPTPKKLTYAYLIGFGIILLLIIVIRFVWGRTKK